MQSSNSNNNFDDDEYIRPPDEVKRERLVDLDNEAWGAQYREEFELAEAIRISNELAEKDDNERMEQYMNEINERREKFKNIHFIFKRVSKYDKDVYDIYEIVNDVIESYIVGVIQSYELDKETYDRIFNVIEKMRFSESERQVLKSILIQIPDK